MKQYTSKFLKSVALFYITFPVSYIFIAALLFDIPAKLCFRILLWPYYYFVGILAIAVGFGLKEMKKWAWYLFLLTNVLIGYENAILVQDYSQSFHKVFAFVCSILFLILFMMRVAKEVRVPYFFPKIRWWESNPRYRLSVPVKLVRNAGEPFEGEILDISLGGCFIKLRSEITQDESVSLNFNVFGHQIGCTGVVVWKTGSTVTHPKGIGVKFTHLQKREKKVLRLATRRLKKIATLYRRSRYLLNQDEFLKRLEELETQSVDQLRTS